MLLKEVLHRVHEQLGIVAAADQAGALGQGLAAGDAQRAHIVRVRPLARQVRPGHVLAAALAAALGQAMEERHLRVHACCEHHVAIG